MKLAAWKYLSVIMALVLVMGTGVTALGPTPAVADNALTHDRATDNVTGKSHRGPSENRTNHFPGFNQYSSPAGMHTAGNSWYVNGATGSDTTGTGSEATPWQTIQHAIDMAGSGDTINIAAQYASGNFYDEQLTISKSIILVGQVVDGDRTRVEQSGLLVVDITVPGLDVRISNMYINSYNWVGQCIRASGDTLTLDNVGFYGDRRIGGSGGGIYADNCTLTLTDCWADGSAQDNGGAIYAVNGSTVTMSRCIIGGDAGQGGGIYAEDSTVTVDDCYFIGCIASAGGAIYLNSSNLAALRCSFNGDWEGMNGDGQGVYVDAVDDNCTMDISNCTFSQNYLDTGDGGGIYVTSQDGYADVTLTYCTFYDNEVNGYGGGLYQVGDNSTTTVRNCIFDNYASEDQDSIYVDGGSIDSDFNIYSDIPSGFTPGADDQTDTAPMCYLLADNSGLTPTCAIDSTSPARHNGTSIVGLTEDQRGVARPGGLSNDIGAYQWVGPTYADASRPNDGGDGLSWATAKKHVYAAANLAGPGSTTHVAAGTYDEENHWDVYDLDYYNIGITKPLTLIGAGAASTSIDGSYPVYENWGPIIDVYDVTEALDDATVAISGLTLKNATDYDEVNYGGGLAIWDHCNATIQNCVIENNYAAYGGGGIYIDYAGEVALTGCTISNNSADDDGGGIYAYYGDNVTISGCTVNGNEASGYGGGIYSDHCYIFSLTDSSVNGNTADSDGGGIYGRRMFGSYDTLISRCTIANNISDSSGGGVYLYSMHSGEDNVTIEACTLSNNEAYGSGGGLYNYSDSSVDLTNCTIYGNSLTNGGDGGGISNFGDAELLNCTIAENDAGSGGVGGGYYEDSGFTGVFKNTILANNHANGSDNDIGGGGTVISLGYNICTTDVNEAYFNGPEDQVNTDPGLGELLVNAPGTTATCAITSASKAYNTGTDAGAPGTDQRGVARPYANLFDVGAYEYDGATPSGPTVSSLTPSSGVNTGSVSITNLAGTNFVSGATVKLTRSGQPDISGSSVGFVSSSQLTCTFNLMGVATGAWNVVVTNPDAQFGILTNGFTVNAPAPPPPPPPNPFIGAGPTSHGGSSGSGAGSPGQSNQGMTPVSMPNIVVQSATISNARVAPGETVTITANLANKGTTNGTSAVKIYVNGQEEAVQGVTVNSGSNRPISFTLSRNEPGTYTVYVGGTQAGSFTVESSRDSDIILWLSMACVLAALILGAVMLWRRQRSYY